jgi:hypothetical protein
VSDQNARRGKRSDRRLQQGVGIGCRRILAS